MAKRLAPPMINVGEMSGFDVENAFSEYAPGSFRKTLRLKRVS